MTEKFSVQRYLRGLKFPFCPGCGNYTVANSFLRGVHELGYGDLAGFVFCSGIGCAAWIPSPYFLADSIHTPHGRSIPVATGVKLFRPELKVVVFGGDGDLAGIGLSHLIHAARRNVDIKVIMVNNMVYGMTGGQVAPTTPFRTVTSTTPYKSFERPIDAVRLVASAGANYAARWTTAHQEQLKESVKKALETPGFCFIETVSQCPTAFGRRAGFKNVAEMLRWFKQNSIPREEAEKMPPEMLEGKIVVGEFAYGKAPTLSENIRQMVVEARKAYA
ncbi:2-oxoacid:ferredoxin oxidoreductase subunit beta [Candidatus Bathyarchaeota archaeon]|nr:MAG: 2-oxoacid:ferredoxin oxidoreductase subunit beta [Candidatus Bathyarchaeota archaeon]